MPANLPLRSILPGPGNTVGIDAGMFTGIPETQASFQQCLAVNLTSAQILALFATPVTLIPAPGVGKSIVVDFVMFRYNYTGTAYASGGVITMSYSGGAAVVNTVPASILTTAASSDTVLVTGASNITTTQNTAIVISNATGAFTTGTGNATVFIWYSIV